MFVDMKLVSKEAYDRACENEDYIRSTECLIELGRSIMDRLGPDKELFLKYEILAGLASGIHEEQICRVGVENERIKDLEAYGAALHNNQSC